jgi:aminoglycoside phosphotransferase (APT) family kinase protein
VQEEVLPGGIANAGSVVRVGDHVLRPVQPATASVHRFLRALHEAGFAGAPRPIAIEADGRERLTFLEGEVAVPPYPDWVQSDEALISLAVLTRQFHDASRSFDPAGSPWSQEMADPAGGVMVCHNDICLENVVFRDGDAVGFLDFDFAAPGDPVRDLATMIRMCVPADDGQSAANVGWEPADRAVRSRLVADAYGLSAEQRMHLLAYLDDSIVRGGEWVRRKVEAGDPNFMRMWTDIGGMERFDRRRRWWRENQGSFGKALL